MLFISVIIGACMAAITFGLFISTGFTHAIVGGAFMLTLLTFVANVANFIKYKE